MEDVKIRRVPVHPMGRWECARPGCGKSGIGYTGKKWCGPTCRSWGYRKEQKAAGRKRFRGGYLDPVRQRDTACRKEKT